LTAGVRGLRPQSAVDVHADDTPPAPISWRRPRPRPEAAASWFPPPPADWQIRDYDADQERIVTFLEKNAGNRLVVPYRQNRAVLFRSRLFHHSDRPEFATGYENHRINLTLLSGR
jgi:hypothetical protein